MFLNHLFRFRYCQPLGVNAISDLIETRSLFALFITIYPLLSLSNDYLYFPVWEPMVCSCSGGWRPAVGEGTGLGVKPESAKDPVEEARCSSDEHRLAADFSADRGSAGSR